MAKNDYRTIFLTFTLSSDSVRVDFLRLRYIVVIHNKRTCKDVCKFLNCTVFLQDFRGAIAESLKISTVSATFIPFIMYWNCNRLSQGRGLT